MRASLAVGILCAAAFVGITATPGHAQYAAQFYPYCELSPASGATTCYFRSREECGSSCISNPWYIGQARAAAETHDRGAYRARHLRPGSSTPTDKSLARHEIRHHSRRQSARAHL
jgi:hypothetical protein